MAQKVALEGLGGERGKFLTHGHGGYLKSSVGDAQTFMMETLDNGRITLACTGSLSGNYFEHDTSGYMHGTSGGTEWIVHHQNNGSIALQVPGVDMYLSHAYSKLGYQGKVGGDGELWKIKKL